MININSNFADHMILDRISKQFENGSHTYSVRSLELAKEWGASGSFASPLELPLSDYVEYFEQKCTHDIPFLSEYSNVTCNLQILPQGSQLNFQSDESASLQVNGLIFFNKHWNWNWGGLFLCDNQETGQRWTFPEYNKLIWFKSPMWNAVSMVSKLAAEPLMMIRLKFSQ